LQLLDRKQAEGIFLVGYKFDDEVIKLAKSLNKPCVYFTQKTEEDMEHVSIDYFAAGQEATNFLIKQGHKKIAYVSEFEELLPAEEEKMAGYKKALKDNELTVKASNIYSAGGRRHNHAYSLGPDVLKDIKKLDAILCSNDELAIGIMNYLLDNGVKVPEDVSIMGFGNIKEGQFVRPQLTTVGEPFYDYGAVGMRTLIKTIKAEKRQTGLIELPFTIEKRESVKMLEK
jgi:LacI family transcriptional regulator